MSAPSAQGRVLVLAFALDEGKVEAGREHGQTCQCVWVHEIFRARTHLSKYDCLVQIHSQINFIISHGEICLVQSFRHEDNIKSIVKQ